MSQEVVTEIELDHPISIVSDLLCDVRNYRKWSRIFSFRFAQPRSGGRALLMARLAGPAVAAIPVKFDRLEPETEVRWSGGFEFAAHGSHYLIMEALDDNRTRLIHGEVFTGPVIDLAWGAVGDNLSKAYSAFNREVARRLG